MPGTRHVRIAPALAALFVLTTACLAWAGSPSTPGSQHTALDLWTTEQLAQPLNPAQAQAERHIRPLPKPDTSPPARTTPLHATAPVSTAQSGIIRRVALPEGDRRVALTFDLCERAIHTTGYDAALVDALRAANARATFFAGGKWMRSHPERSMQLMADPRFELGNHSWTHANMFVVTPNEFDQQVQWANAQFELLREQLRRRLSTAGFADAPQTALRLFRLPYGRGNAATAARLNHMGLAVIQWDVVGEGGGNAEQRAREILAEVRPGSIILLHANAIPHDTAGIVRHLLQLLAQNRLYNRDRQRTTGRRYAGNRSGRLLQLAGR